MSNKISVHILPALLCLVLIAGSCNSARHLPEGQYLLKENTIKFKNEKYLDKKGELSDRLSGATVQKPNSSFIFDGLKLKLFLYNIRYKKYQSDSANFQLESRTVEAPVVYDSTTIQQSKTYMESYLFQQGYFYANIEDTTKFNEKKKKATVVYNVDPGINYLIKRVFFSDIEDSLIRSIVREVFNATFLRAGKPYSADLVEQERSRLTTVMRDRGFYYFSNNNISFVLDTANTEFVKEDESLLKDATELVTLRKERPRPTLDIYINITDNEEGTAFKRYAINRITVYPDFRDRSDARDSSMIQRKIDNTTFRYHDYYIREKVLHNHTFLQSNTYYSQNEYDKTLTELNSLGTFESVRILFFEDTTRKEATGWLNTIVLLSPADKYDFNANWEASTGTTYTLGSGLTLGLQHKNIAKGANLLSTSISGSIENQFDTLQDKFFILTRSLGINASIEFPKFLLPISRERYSIRNSPRTEIAVGANMLDRVRFFRLINISSRFTYKWRETSTKSWEVSPIFFNDISLPKAFIDSNFQKRLDTNDFLRNSYRETFIEGENITWTFSNAQKAKWYDDYSYIRLGIEEAGALISGIAALRPGIVGHYSQYVKLDYDLRHFIVQRHATTALRLYGGVGIPYGPNSTTLPYLKQYFVGGPFSMRGWRIRTLGPGGYVDTSKLGESNTNSFIDLTGDIKIEMNAEYRFEIFKLFGGMLLFNGALFGDAGNIWLARKSPSYKYGEFQIGRLYNDMAVSGGMGIRIDIAGLFVFRTDLAMPLKTPENPDYDDILSQGWLPNGFEPLNGHWRKRNFVLNIAIGYPF